LYIFDKEENNLPGKAYGIKVGRRGGGEGGERRGGVLGARAGEIHDPFLRDFDGFGTIFDVF